MSGAKKYRLRPAPVCAVAWTGDNWAEIDAFAGGALTRHGKDVFTKWAAGEGFDPDKDVYLRVGWFLIKDAGGELSALSAEDFRAAYEEAD